MNTRQGHSEQRVRDRAASHAELRDRLVAAGEAAIASVGLAGLKARALAEEAGCSVGAIYGVFPDLDGLILAVNGRTLDAIAAALTQVSDRGGAAEHLVRLADAYLSYAAHNGPRWRALFQHQLTPGRALDAEFLERRRVAFSFIEAPLARLCPTLTGEKRTALARTLFSAVHGMVDLGLDEKVANVTSAALREQIRQVVTAIVAGLRAA